MTKIYVASSWRNQSYPALVDRLRADGFDVWDWRDPPNGDSAFKWEEIEPNYKHGDPVSTAEYRNWLIHPAAERGFANDFDGMEWCDICVLLLPCGRSAHTEAGFIRGRGKPVFVVRPDYQEPDLMYKLHCGVFDTYGELLAALEGALNYLPR